MDRKKTETGSDINFDKMDQQTLPDLTPRREGGDDALAESSPTDSRLDEKVIANRNDARRSIEESEK